MRLLLLLAFGTLVFRSHADPYLLFSEKGKIGMKDEAGRVVIPASFDALGWSDGSFSVVGQVTGYKLKDHWGLLNLKKQLLSEAIYESLTYPGGDRIIARKKTNPVQTRTGCIDLHGDVVVPFRYDGIAIVGLRAVVFTKSGANYSFGLIDLSGREIIPVQYKNIYPLGTLRFAVENGAGKTALFSENGSAVTPFRIDSISSFRNNLAVIYEDLHQGLIDRNGDIRIEPQFQEIKIDREGVVWTRAPNEWKILSGDNRQIRTLEADELTPWGQGYYRVSRGRRSSIVDRDFNTVLPFDYESISEPRDGGLIIAKKEKFGIIRRNGSVLLPFQFDSLAIKGRLVRASCLTSGKMMWSVYDTFGIQKTKHAYDRIEPFNGKFFPVRNRGYWGAVNRYGEEFIHCVFDSLLQFSDNLIVVKYKGLYGIINANEDWLLPPQALQIRVVNSERYLAISEKTTFLRDFAGTVIYFTENKIECNPDFIVETSTDGTEKRVNYQGRIIERTVIPAVDRVEKIFPESEGLRGIQKDGKYGFVDRNGRLRISNRYEGIGVFTEGLAPVRIMEKWGYIDTDEKIVIQPSFDKAGQFENGRATVKRGGKYGMIDTHGKELLVIRYDSIVPLPDKNLLLVSSGLQGLAAGDGRIQVLVDPKYDHLDDNGNGYVVISREGKHGLLTLQGVSTVPLMYDQLTYDRQKNQYLAQLRPAWKKWPNP